jgi:DNA polymerase-1
VLIIADYSQQEPRVTAHYSQDPALVELFLKGDGDTHSLMARKIFSVMEGTEQDISKEKPGWSDDYNMSKRKVGKIINLGLDYGKTAYSLQFDLNISYEEAEKLVNDVKKSFPEKEHYFKRKKEESLRNGYVLIDPVIRRKSYIRSLLNQIKAFNSKKDKNSEDWSALSSYDGALERKTKNYPIQGTAASITKLALVKIYNYQLKNNAWDLFQIVNSVHDEIVIETKRENAEQVAKLVQKLMEEAGEKFSSIPMIAEPTITDWWTH